MATVKLVKKSHGLKAAAKGAAPKKGDFAFVDNQDDSYTVSGVDAAGAAVDISAVATITAASDNPGAFTADAPSGMTGTLHGVAPGSGNLTVVATWTDGSVGPFTITVPITVTGGPATGLKIDFGPPTVR